MPSFPFSYVLQCIVAVITACDCCTVSWLLGLWLGGTPHIAALGWSSCDDIFRASYVAVVSCIDLIGWDFSGGVLGFSEWLEGMLVSRGALRCSW